MKSKVSELVEECKQFFYLVAVVGVRGFAQVTPKVGSGPFRLAFV